MKNLRYLFPLLFLFACGGSGGSDTAVTTAAAPVNVGDYETVAIPGVDGLVRAIKKNGVGRTIEEGTLLNGQKHGAWIIHDDVKQQIVEIVNYHEGKKCGVSIKPNFAREKEKSYYANDVLHGPSETYGNNAKPSMSSTYVNGQLEGKVVKYYDDGTTLKEESNYKNGKMHGSSKFYDQEGNVKLEYTYKNGKMVK